MHLKNNNIKVFYDEYEKAFLWGKDLYSHLSDVYSKRAHFCLMIISKYYEQKQWTNLERKAAQSKAFLANQEYILPLRLDDTEIPGILPTTVYIDFKDTNIAEIVNLIIEKAKKHCSLTRFYNGNFSKNIKGKNTNVKDARWI